MLLFLAPIVLLCPTSLGAVRKVHEVNVHTWSDADGAIICIFSHFLLHKKQGIFSDSADLVKLLYYSLPGAEGKFQCLFYDQSWFINNFDHVYFLWHTKINRLKKKAGVSCFMLIDQWIIMSSIFCYWIPGLKLHNSRSAGSGQYTGSLIHNIFLKLLSVTSIY